MRQDGRKISRRDLCRAAAAVALAMAVLGGAGWLLGRTAGEGLPATSGGLGIDRRRAASGPADTLWYEGCAYRRKEEIECYLFLGIDVMDPVDDAARYVAGGQADAQILLVLDDEARTWQLLQINRDSMVEVPVLSMMGTVPYTVVQQISLAHAYGDGREESCENSVAAVSMMLGGQPIDGYFALNMGGVPALVDLLGGVELTVASDFSAVDPALTEGAAVTLDGAQALAYVRTRQGVDDQTDLARMVRQRQFLAALWEKASDLDPVLEEAAWEAVTDYAVTDIAGGSAVSVAQRLRDYTALPVCTIAGENLVEDGCWAYYLDEESLQQTILRLFYTELD